MQTLHMFFIHLDQTNLKACNLLNYFIRNLVFTDRLLKSRQHTLNYTLQTSFWGTKHFLQQCYKNMLTIFLFILYLEPNFHGYYYEQHKYPLPQTHIQLVIDILTLESSQGTSTQCGGIHVELTNHNPTMNIQSLSEL